MSEQPTSNDLAREVTRATSANPQDRGYIPDQSDGDEQPNGTPSLAAEPGQVTQSPYDEHGALANAGIPLADAPPGRTAPRSPGPLLQDEPGQPGRPGTDTAGRNDDRADIATNP